MTRVDPEISVTGGEPVIEPTGNTGEMMVVGISLRRVGAISGEGSVLDEPVVERIPIGTSERCRLDVSGYPAGMYAVRVTAADGTSSTATCVILH